MSVFPAHEDRNKNNAHVLRGSESPQGSTGPKGDHSDSDIFKYLVTHKDHRKMKSITLFISIMLAPFLSYSQSGIIKFNPVPLAGYAPTISLGYEHVLSPKNSIQFNVDYATETDFGFTSTWLGLGAEYRIYNLVPSLNIDESGAPSGLYVAPTAGIRFFKDVDKDDPDPAFDEKYNFANVGALVGYQWLPKFKNGSSPLALEASVGLLGGFMLKDDRFDYEDYMMWPRFSVGFVPAFNIGIGFAFGK